MLRRQPKNLDAIIGQDAELVEYAVHSISEGIDALGEVTVRISDGADRGRTISGHGADLDIIVASAKAYVNALNKMASVMDRRSHVEI